MPRQIQLILLVLAILVIVIVFFPGRIPAAPQGALARLLGQPPPLCPDFTTVIPETWSIVSVFDINSDNDNEKECLLFYRYDVTPAGSHGLIGGVIFDPQIDHAPGNLATPQPFRPGMYVPYPLLPRNGSQGYLGEQRVTFDVYDADGDGEKEVVILGYSGYNDLVTTLSIFKWQGEPVSNYRLLTAPYEFTLVGDAGIDIVRAATPTSSPGPLTPSSASTNPNTTPTSTTQPTGPILKVLVRQRFDEPPAYVRSLIARQIEYQWSGTTTKRTLQEKGRSLTFAYGRPDGAKEPGRDHYPVSYPEQAVLAHYPDGQVRDLLIPANVESGNEIEIGAIASDRSGQLWQTTWRVTKTANKEVRKPTEWTLTPVGATRPIRQ